MSGLGRAVLANPFSFRLGHRFPAERAFHRKPRALQFNQYFVQLAACAGIGELARQRNQVAQPILRIQQSALRDKPDPVEVMKGRQDPKAGPPLIEHRGPDTLRPSLRAAQD